MIQERHLFISGSVQGVGFRAAVKKCALIYGIKGFAKNLPDGRVEICAQGRADQIEAFSHSIQEKPGLGSISSIESKSGSLEAVYSDFKIL